MNKIIALLLLGATSLFAAPQLKISADADRPIIIPNDLGDIRIQTVVTDLSDMSKWFDVSPQKVSPPCSGAEVTQTHTYPFTGGATLNTSVNAKLGGGGDVSVKTTWKPSAPTPGLVVHRLWLSVFISDDLLVDLDGSPFYPFPVAGDSYSVSHGGTLTFRKKSSGAFLFKATGDYAGARLHYFTEHPEWGLSVDFHRVADDAPDAKKFTLTASEINWKLSFKK